MPAGPIDPLVSYEALSLLILPGIGVWDMLGVYRDVKRCIGV